MSSQVHQYFVRRKDLKLRIPPRILIVEDEAIIALNLKLQIEKAGFEVCGIVATGKDAIEQILLPEKPGIVLMDIGLRGNMDGLDAAREILAMQTIPIILMTGYSEQDIRNRAPDLVPLLYLTKPIRMHELTAMVTKIAAESTRQS
jgi:CheY-like chemotaxis protein